MDWRVGSFLAAERNFDPKSRAVPARVETEPWLVAGRLAEGAGGGGGGVRFAGAVGTAGGAGSAGGVLAVGEAGAFWLDGATGAAGAGGGLPSAGFEGLQPVIPGSRASPAASADALMNLRMPSILDTSPAIRQQMFFT